MLLVDIFQYQRMVIFASFDSGERSVQVDRVIMGIREITSLDSDLSSGSGSMDDISVAYGDVAGVFPWHKVTVSIRDIGTHLNQPSETVHKVYVQPFGIDIFTLPGKCACRFTYCTAGKFKDHTKCLHVRSCSSVTDADNAVWKLGNRTNIAKWISPAVGPVVSCHLFPWRMCNNGIGTVNVSLCPVILVGVRTLFTGPFNRISLNDIRETVWDVEIGVVRTIFGSHIGNGHLGNGWHLKVPGKIFQLNILGFDNGKRHHVAVHHKEGTISVNGQVLMLFNQNSDRLLRVLQTVGVGGVVVADFCFVLVNLVFAPREFQYYLLALFFFLFGSCQCLLDGFCTIFFPSRIDAVFGSVKMNSFVLFFFCLSRQKREVAQEQTAKKKPGQQFLWVSFHIFLLFSIYLHMGICIHQLSYLLWGKDIEKRKNFLCFSMMIR